MFKGIDDDDRPFIGRKAILARARGEDVTLEDDGADGRLARLRPSYTEAGLIPPKDHTPVHEDMMVYDDDVQRVGYATSFMYSPVLQRHIALARVRPDLAKPGTKVNLEFTINHRYEQVGAQVARLPALHPAAKDGIEWSR